MNYHLLFENLKKEIKLLELSKKSGKQKENYSSDYYWWEEGFNECLLSITWKYENLIKFLIKEIKTMNEQNKEKEYNHGNKI